MANHNLSLLAPLKAPKMMTQQPSPKPSESIKSLKEKKTSFENGEGPTPGGPLTPDRVKELGIVKMNDYLVSGTRQQFWDEYYVKVIMQVSNLYTP